MTPKLTEVFVAKEAPEKSFVLQSRGSAPAPVELVRSSEHRDPVYGPMGGSAAEEHPHVYKALNSLFTDGDVDRSVGREVNRLWGKIDHAKQAIELRPGLPPRVVPKVKDVPRRAV